MKCLKKIAIFSLVFFVSLFFIMPVQAKSTQTYSDENMVQWTTEEKGEVSFTDTKVGSLPETGGIGTTIFTVGGCAIMVVAAALFFMNKKKHEK